MTRAIYVEVWTTANDVAERNQQVEIHSGRMCFAIFRSLANDFSSDTIHNIVVPTWAWLLNQRDNWEVFFVLGFDLFRRHCILFVLQSCRVDCDGARRKGYCPLLPKFFSSLPRLNFIFRDFPYFFCIVGERRFGIGMEASILYEFGYQQRFQLVWVADVIRTDIMTSKRNELIVYVVVDEWFIQPTLRLFGKVTRLFISIRANAFDIVDQLVR